MNLLTHPDVLRSRNFADGAHCAMKQLRKKTNLDYVTHLDGVAVIVATVPHTIFMLQATYLHDVVEDTGVTIVMIKHRFGKEVANMVEWLSDVSKPHHGNRKTRTAMDRDHISCAPGVVQTIKVADISHNTHDIATSDPDFARVYLPEKAMVLNVLNDAEPELLAKVKADVEYLITLMNIKAIKL